MASTPENTTGNGQDEIQRLRTQIRQQIERSNPEQQRQLAQALMQELRSVNRVAQEVNERDVSMRPEEAKQVRNAVEKVKVGIEKGIIKVNNPRARAVLEKLAKQEMTTAVANALQPIFEKYIQPDKDVVISTKDQQASEFEKDLITIYSQNTQAGQALANSVSEAAAEGEIQVSQQDLQARLEEVEKQVGRVGGRGGREGRGRSPGTGEAEPDDDFFDPRGKWGMYYSNFYDKSNTEHTDVLKAISSVNEFEKWVHKVRQEVIKEHHGGHEPHSQHEKDHIDEILSEKIENQFIMTLSKPLERFDVAQPTTSAHSVMQQGGLYNSINAVLEAILQDIQQLTTNLEMTPEGREINERVSLFKKKEIIKTGEKVVEVKNADGTPGERRYSQITLSPLAEEKRVKLSEFMQFMRLEYDEYREVRELLHDMNVIFHQQPGKDGFWGGVAGFAERFTSTTLDAMEFLPDAKLVKEAFHLYDKFIEEDFAKLNWIHHNDQFRELMGTNRNRIQESVLEYLMEAHKSDTEKIDEYRFRAAVSMATGLARGIYINEPEKASWADPALTTDGNPEFFSYYIKDPNPLIGLNPLHGTIRWGSEGAMNPMLFIPIEGAHLSEGVWDHQFIWKRISEFQDSWINGKKAFPEGQGKMFIDYMVNVGGVGGPVRRGGWRMSNAYKDFWEFDSKLHKVDYLRTWINIENIGYEVLVDFVDKHRIAKAYLSGDLDQRAFDEAGLSLDEARQFNDFFEGDFSSTAENSKRSLFQYLYKKYIGNYKGGLDAYYGELKDSARKTVIKEIGEGKRAPDDIEKEIESEASSMFLQRTLNRVIAQRMPSKFVRIERNRHSREGTRRWELIRQALNQHGEHFELTDMDDAMKDIALAETLLRREASDNLRKAVKLRHQAKLGSHGGHGGHGNHEESAHKQFLATGSEYNLLSKDKLEKLLKGKLGDNEDARIVRARKVLNEINKQFAAKDEFLEGFKKDYPFAFGSDELDTSFLTWRAGGQRILPRAIGEIGGAEANLANEIMHFGNILQATAMDGKHDVSKIIESIAKGAKWLDGVHGKQAAHTYAHHMAAIAISYFKKDTRAKLLFGAMAGKKNSLAAEFAGTSLGVWEWDARDIDKFIDALERSRVLAKEPYEIQKPPTYEPVYLNVGGKLIKVPNLKKRKADYVMFSKQLRREFGGSGFHIAVDAVNTYIPIAMAIVLLYYLKQAFDEWKPGAKK